MRRLLDILTSLERLRGSIPPSVRGDSNHPLAPLAVVLSLAAEGDDDRDDDAQRVEEETR